MTIKLLLLKSGEDIIADVSEMAMGEVGDKDNPTSSTKHPVESKPFVNEILISSLYDL